MGNAEELARILAVMRVDRKGVSQPERVHMLLEKGVDETLERLQGNALFVDDALLDSCRLEVESWTHRNIRVVSLFDPAYPQHLLSVHEAPALLFYSGHLAPDDEAVAIVGSREATAQEQAAAFEIAQLVGTRHGLTVASGLARGIDAAAHRGALAAGARTVAVMGTSIEKTYPQEHADLREHIESSGGLVLSQFLPGTSPNQRTFPMRNVTMSGYSIATIVVAAGEHSGTRQQARRALAHSRNVILLPGVIHKTAWARAMLTSPGVFAVTDLDNLSHALTTIRHNRDLLASPLPAS